MNTITIRKDYTIDTIVNEYNALTAAMYRVKEGDVFDELVQMRIKVWKDGRNYFGDEFLNKLMD